jgi:hypothetical protein
VQPGDTGYGTVKGSSFAGLKRTNPINGTRNFGKDLGVVDEEVIS